MEKNMKSHREHFSENQDSVTICGHKVITASIMDNEDTEINDELQLLPADKGIPGKQFNG